MSLCAMGLDKSSLELSFGGDFDEFDEFGGAFDELGHGFGKKSAWGCPLIGLRFTINVYPLDMFWGVGGAVSMEYHLIHLACSGWFTLRSAII